MRNTRIMERKRERRLNEMRYTNNGAVVLEAASSLVLSPRLNEVKRRVREGAHRDAAWLAVSLQELVSVYDAW